MCWARSAGRGNIFCDYTWLAVYGNGKLQSKEGLTRTLESESSCRLIGWRSRQYMAVVQSSMDQGGDLGAASSSMCDIGLTT